MNVVASLAVYTLGKPWTIFLGMNILTFGILAVWEVDTLFMLYVTKRVPF